MMNNLGGQMRRGEENNSWKGWYSDECKKGKGKVMKATYKWNKEKTLENRYKTVEAKKKNYTRKQWRRKEKYGRIRMRITQKDYLTFIFLAARFRVFKCNAEVALLHEIVRAAHSG
jgi:hypothetical protein